MLQTRSVKVFPHPLLRNLKSLSLERKESVLLLEQLIGSRVSYYDMRGEK